MPKCVALDPNGEVVEGRYFDNDHEASAYERELVRQAREGNRDARLMVEVDRYLDMKPWPKNDASAKRERTKAREAIRGWLMYDARQRPGRYRDVMPEVDEVETDAAGIELAEATG